MDEKKMLTVKETAERLRVSQRTIFNFIKQGKLKPVRLGGIKKTGKNLIPVEQVEQLLKPKEIEKKQVPLSINNGAEYLKKFIK